MYSPELARDPRIVSMPGMVERLAESEDEQVLTALAENPALPEFPGEVIAKLLLAPASSDIVLRREDVPWDLPELAPYAILRDGPSVYRRVAQQTTRPEIARYLAGHYDRSVRAALAENPNLPEDLIGRLAQDGAEVVRAAIAKNPAAARYPQVAARLAHDRLSVRQGLAANPAILSLPREILQNLVDDAEVFFSVLSVRPDLPWDEPPFAPYAILRGNTDDHSQFAQRPDLADYPQAIKMLANHPEPSVCLALGRNPAIVQLSDLVMEIIQSASPLVREALASNPAIDRLPDAVQELAADRDVNVLSALAANPIITKFPEVARRLASGAKHLEREELAANPAFLSLPKEIVLDLAQDAVVFFASLSARSDLPWDQPPFAPYAILRGGTEEHKQAAQRQDLMHYPEAAKMLAKHPDSKVRAALASNPTIAQIDYLAEHLAQDRVERVRAALAGNPALAHLPDVAWMLAEDQSGETVAALVTNPAIVQFPGIAKALAKSNTYACWKLVTSPLFLSLPMETLQDIVKSPRAFFSAVAECSDLPWDQPPFAPYAILRGGREAHKSAALRPDLPNYPEAVYMLAKHPDLEVRAALASNPAIVQFDDIVRDVLLRDLWAVRKAIASNPGIGLLPDVVAALVAEDEIDILVTLAANPAIANFPEIVQSLPKEDEEIRKSLAKNPALQHQRGIGWIETKAINGRRYRYLRWREGGKKRSRYLGKAAET